VQYNLIPVSSYDDIKRVTFKSFGAYGKKLDNKYYEKEWLGFNSLTNIQQLQRT
jgi:hypothetical protein